MAGEAQGSVRRVTVLGHCVWHACGFWVLRRGDARPAKRMPGSPGEPVRHSTIASFPWQAARGREPGTQLCGTNPICPGGPRVGRIWPVARTGTYVRNKANSPERARAISAGQKKDYERNAGDEWVKKQSQSG